MTKFLISQRSVAYKNSKGDINGFKIFEFDGDMEDLREIVLALKENITDQTKVEEYIKTKGFNFEKLELLTLNK